MRTPKTLNEAIRAGLVEAMGEREAAHLEDREALFADEIIEKHVRDYLSQSFTVANLGGLSVTKLWEHITGKNFGRNDA